MRSKKSAPEALAKAANPRVLRSGSRNPGGLAAKPVTVVKKTTRRVYKSSAVVNDSPPPSPESEDDNSQYVF